MSRIGEQPITIEEGVQVNVKDRVVTVSGSDKEVTMELPDNVNVEVKDNEVLVTRVNDEKESKALHGTYRMLIFNAVEGIKNGFEKKLELVGVGYRAKMEGTTLVMSLGWNHPVKIESPEGITIEVPEETKVVLKGFDKQKVGQLAAKIRSIRKPEPYKGKGIRYEGEHVKRKSSKAGVGA